MVAPFGASLHVSGRDARRSRPRSRPPRRSQVRLDEIEPSLEDVFIGLMARAKDNIQ